MPVVLAANTSPVCELVKLTLIDAKFGKDPLSRSVTVPVGSTRLTGLCVLPQSTVKSVPSADPFKSMAGGFRSIPIVATTGALSERPSLTTIVIVSKGPAGPPFVLL